MDLGKLLDNAKTAKGKNGKTDSNGAKSNGHGSAPPPIKKAQSSPSLSVFIPPKSATTSKAVSTAPSIPEEDFDYHEFINLDDGGRLDAINTVSQQLNEESTRMSATVKLCNIMKNCGVKSYEGEIIISYVIENIEQQLSFLNPKNREGVLFLSVGLLESVGTPLEPFYVPLLPKLLSSQSDRSAFVRDQSQAIIMHLADLISPHSFRVVYPYLLQGMLEEDWRVKVSTLQFIKALSPRVSTHLSPLLPQLIPAISECIYDSKRQVQLAGIDAMTEACKVISNDDIRPIVPQLVAVIANPDETTKTLNVLLETTFVADVDASVLALLAPLLSKALKSRSSVVKRKASKVIDIMCRLVKDPRHVAPFEPLLLPALDKVIDEIVDSEVCDVAKAARQILINALNGLKTDSNGLVEEMENLKLDEKSDGSLLDSAQVEGNIAAALKSVLVTATSPYDQLCIRYMSQLCANLAMYATPPNPNIPADPDPTVLWRYAISMTDNTQWKICILPYLPAVFPLANRTGHKDEDVDRETNRHFEKLVHDCRVSALGDIADMQAEEDGDDTSLCNIEFSLAFGGKILLQNTHLKLGKGRKYGIMGKNGAGKTTLLTNIGLGTIEGLPAHIKTIYVQHDDQSDDMSVSLIDELAAAKVVQEAGSTKEEALALLRSINFTEDMIHSPRSGLSGGWKMKLLIVKAMLSKANVLLLDEPTNHLDAASVKWLTEYLQGAVDITCLIVTHDTIFLDNVATDIIHYENKKLVYYHGNLTDFVRIHPEAKYYFELSTSTMRFKFPTPERLEGINSNTRAVMRMENVSFTYPGKITPQLQNVNVKVCLGSRIAVLGANGAGKSTLIKLLVQETEPDAGSGEIWKHMNLRVAYVAQHSFHHVEQHLDDSPVDYIKWRFAGGVDRENLARPTMKMSEEEEDKRVKRYGDVDQCVGRRKNGRTMEYECTFIGQTARDPNKYIAVEKMIEMGLGKLVQQTDARVAAAAAGLDLRPLLIAEIQGHLNDFNLESEYGTHSTIKRLSGGQKVKLVLAAAMWNKPHIIVLDEPTNYLDREALGALTQAIKEFAGGVVIISHNSEFTSAICTETWLVKDGTCFTDGEASETAGSAASGSSGGAVKKSKSLSTLSDTKDKDDSGGNINSSIQSEVILNPKTLESLSKKEIRKLERLAIVAGMSLKEYVSKINSKSPEWKWL